MQVIGCISDKSTEKPMREAWSRVCNAEEKDNIHSVCNQHCTFAQNSAWSIQQMW